jgi:hypothetical protein
MIGFIVRLVVELVIAAARLAVLLGSLAGMLLISAARMAWRYFRNRQRPRRSGARPSVTSKPPSARRAAPRPLRPKPWEQP